MKDVARALEPNDSNKKIVVLGMGNLLLRDEGVGIHVIRALQNSPLPTSVDLEIVDGGTSPDVLHLTHEADKLVIIDAVAGGGEPGSVYRFQVEDITPEGQHIVSLHQIGLIESLETMEYMGARPKNSVIIGVEPKEIDWGLELSPELREEVPQIVGIVLEEIMEQARTC